MRRGCAPGPHLAAGQVACSALLSTRKNMSSGFFHFSVSAVSRASASSAAAKSDYIARAGEYNDERDARRDKQLHACSGNMPSWAPGWEGANSEKRAAVAHAYWIAADAYERKNARLASELEFALPVQLSLEQQIELSEKFAREVTTTSDGKLPFSLAIHAGRGRNPHVHLLVSDRANDGVERSPRSWFARAANADKDPASGGARKCREWNSRELVNKLRERWEATANAALDAAGHHTRIDRRSYADRGLDIVPTVHAGWGPGRDERLALNAQIRERNAITLQLASLTQQRAFLLEVLGSENKDESRLSRRPARQRTRDTYAAEQQFADARFERLASEFDGLDAVVGLGEPDAFNARGIASAAAISRVTHLPGGMLNDWKSRSDGVLSGAQDDGLVDVRAEISDALRRERTSDRDAEQPRLIEPQEFDQVAPRQRAEEPEKAGPPAGAGGSTSVEINAEDSYVKRQKKAENAMAAGPSVAELTMRMRANIAAAEAEVEARIAATAAAEKAKKNAEIDAKIDAQIAENRAKNEAAKPAAAAAPAAPAAAPDQVKLVQPAPEAEEPKKTVISIAQMNARELDVMRAESAKKEALLRQRSSLLQQTTAYSAASIASAKAAIRARKAALAKAAGALKAAEAKAGGLLGFLKRDELAAAKSAYEMCAKQLKSCIDIARCKTTTEQVAEQREKLARDEKILQTQREQIAARQLEIKREEERARIARAVDDESPLNPRRFNHRGPRY